jgi:ribonuclease P/MRP protein subunit RPP1
MRTKKADCPLSDAGIRMFYDLEVHSTLSIGENSVEELAIMAKKLNISGIGLVTYWPEAVEVPKIEGIDVISAVMIKTANPQDLNSMARKARNKAELLLVHGGNYEVNRAACENPLIDILCHPELGRKDSGLDHICMKAANENNVAVEVNFREILESYKRNRIYMLSSMKKNVKLCMKYDVPVITCSGAVTKWGMRSGRELAAIAYLLGMELGKAIATTSAVPETFVKKNREKLSGKQWSGIEVEGNE